MKGREGEGRGEMEGREKRKGKWKGEGKHTTTVKNHFRGIKWYSDYWFELFSRNLEDPWRLDFFSHYFFKMNVYGI